MKQAPTEASAVSAWDEITVPICDNRSITVAAPFLVLSRGREGTVGTFISERAPS